MLKVNTNMVRIGYWIRNDDTAHSCLSTTEALFSAISKHIITIRVKNNRTTMMNRPVLVSHTYANFVSTKQLFLAAHTVACCCLSCPNMFGRVI